MIKENIISIQQKRMLRTFAIVLIGLSLQGCLATRSHIGAGLGATTTTVACVSAGIDNPYVIAMCTLGGALAGADMMYQSDYDVHYGTFVDHMNVTTSGSSYTNWHNRKTGNNGIIHTTSLYYDGPFKCVDYDVTVNITSPWPVIGMGNVDRRQEFGTACQMPDGRWLEKPYKNPYTGKWESANEN